MLESLRDQPGTQREYETIYILRPEANNEQIHTVNTRLRKIIDDADGRLIRLENWGKRKLAYEIQNQTKGIYLYWRYLAKAQLVAEIERNLRMLDTVVRYLTVKIDEDVDSEARPVGVTDEVFSAAAETRPDEEDYYLGRTAPRDDEQQDGAQAAEKAGTGEASAEGDAAAQQPEQASAAEPEASPETQPEAAPEAVAVAAAEEPAAVASEQPAEASSEQPAEASSEQPAAEASSEQPAAEASEQPAAEASEQPAAEASEQPAEASSDEPKKEE